MKWWAVPALARALRTLLEQPDYAQALAQAARAEAEVAFDVSVMQAGYEALLRRVHGGAGAGASTGSARTVL